MSPFRPRITEDDKYILRDCNIWEYLLLATESDAHEANNFLLAAAYCLGTFNGQLSNEVVLKTFNNIMYSRLFLRESNGYPISESERIGIENLQAKIENAAEKFTKTNQDISERVNTFIINILIDKGWWTPAS